MQDDKGNYSTDSGKLLKGSHILACYDITKTGYTALPPYKHTDLCTG